MLFFLREKGYYHSKTPFVYVYSLSLRHCRRSRVDSPTYGLGYGVDDLKIAVATD